MILFADDVDRSPEAYRRFCEKKSAIAPGFGFDVAAEDINPLLTRHQPPCVQWAAHGGRRALFEAFGLGKTFQQLELARLVLAREDCERAIIVCPLGVRQEFMRDARALLTGEHPNVTEERRDALRTWQENHPERLMPEPVFIRTSAEVKGKGLYLTNYESVREGKLDLGLFDSVDLDEAACLRGFGGSKTFREFMAAIEDERIRYRFVATACPDPNQVIELLVYAAWLGIMDIGQAKTRFFRRDSGKADNLTLHPHKETDFWHWVATWAVFLQKPSDLGFSDEGYDLPGLEVHWHEIPADYSDAGAERDGQGRLYPNAAIGVQDAARVKRNSLDGRLAKLLELREEDPAAHRLLWHDLEAEREALEASVPGVVSVYGNQGLDERERAILDFSDGKIQELAAKPVMAGSGCNFQRHCHWAIYLGIGFKFHDFIQSVYRLLRFLQTEWVRIDLIYSEAEREVRRALEDKWRQHDAKAAIMGEIIRTYGLNVDAMRAGLARSIEIERKEVTGPGFRAVHNDAFYELHSMASDSVGFCCTSIPFEHQYEYTHHLADFGHSESPAQFWEQMSYATPQLYRVMKPGRVVAIHIKDRITPGGINGFGFQTLSEVHCRAIAHYKSHGFAFLGMKTIVTDVVRENNQTYRLGWSEHIKDGSRQGCGVPEYVLLFRKPPTDRSNGYADEPVRKQKPLCDDSGEALPFHPKRNWKRPLPGTGYSRAIWQLDANGFARSSGDRLLSSDELRALPHADLYKLWRDRSLSTVYDFGGHLAITEELDRLEKLPAKFALLPPHSWHPDVWTDVARMRTLNTFQAVKGKEQHLCPMPLDIVRRLIVQFSMPGDVVLDHFAGIGSVPYEAIKLGREAVAIELSPAYFPDLVFYCELAVQEASAPTLFDLLEVEGEPAAEIPGELETVGVSSLPLAASGEGRE